MAEGFADAFASKYLGTEVLPNGRVIKRYERMIIVDDPNVNIENEEERLKLVAELRAMAGPPNVDLAAVSEKLRELPTNRRSHSPGSSLERSTISGSPCPPERRQAYIRRLEAARHRYLLEQGCPPCIAHDYSYPEDEPVPPAARYFYPWASVGPVSSASSSLGAQAYRWSHFLQWQDEGRSLSHQDSDPPAKFASFMDRHRKLLRENQRTESASLLALSLDVKEQSRLQNWIEFQVYHYNLLRREIRRQERAMRAAGDGSGRGPSQDEISELERHREFMEWVEEQRLALTATARDDEGKGWRASRQSFDEWNEEHQATAEPEATETDEEQHPESPAAAPKEGERRATTRRKSKMDHPAAAPLGPRTLRSATPARNVRQQQTGTTATLSGVQGKARVAKKKKTPAASARTARRKAAAVQESPVAETATRQSGRLRQSERQQRSVAAKDRKPAAAPQGRAHHDPLGPVHTGKISKQQKTRKKTGTAGAAGRSQAVGGNARQVPTPPVTTRTGRLVRPPLRLGFENASPAAN